MFWRIYQCATCLSYLQWQLLITIIAVGCLFWTATRAASGSRDNARGIVAGFDTKTDGTILNLRSVPVSKSIRPQPPQKQMSPQRRLVEKSPQEMRSLTTPVTATTAYCRDVKSWNSAIPKPTPTHYPGSLNRSLKKPDNCCRSNKMPSPCNNRKSIIKSNKSFKPQLEDIKSSFLLLNNTNKNVNTQQSQGIQQQYMRVDIQ
ncbi:uncharacterized protein LOC112049541 isoform X2 [Bicyclus anynana]|uniref:Uncharacterized protein LOC112049541 isoform X2 n=1 Tax=Bicyclus anynana TaxID=110368 RepID=A0ABM3LLZ1_BICAN|nr:uncharacterized protein LOC112049541 isoform X2 [Bicyclus anynana]